MPNLVWNAQERRPRAGWRILAHGLLIGLFMGGAPLFSTVLYELTSPGAGASPGLSAALRILHELSSLAGVLIATWLAARFLDRRPYREYGFRINRAWWVDLCFGLLLGAVLMGLVFSAELSAGWLVVTSVYQSQWLPFSLGALVALVTFIRVGISEELISRGYHLRNLAEGLNLPAWGPKAALLGGYIFSSTLFGLFHLANPNASWSSTLNIILAGFFLGLGYILTGQLAIPIGLHISWNFFQGSVFGLPVSGLTSSTSVLAVRQSGPVLWTGGAFGPEAGLLGVFAILLGCLLILGWVRLRGGTPRLREELAVYHPNQPADEPQPGSPISLA